MKSRAPRNRTVCCSEQEKYDLSQELISISSNVTTEEIKNRIIHQDVFEAFDNLPRNFVDLLIMDPPYNLSKNYNGHLFKEKEASEYQEWFASVVGIMKPLLKNNATVYVCSDWKTSVLTAPILEREFQIQNRITWEREKGRGAKRNWKNNTEDIWFCTMSKQYTFNVEDVKMKRQVIAPYRREDGRPKDWQEESAGNFRLTHPSNIWTDISIPFWSMPENTDHPTQKPEKLIAKLILASSNPGDMVLDPFSGSGTTAVAAKKLGRSFVGIEINKEYCYLALKRLKIADENPDIQGYAEGVFWERNSFRNTIKEKRLRNVKSNREKKQDIRT